MPVIFSNVDKGYRQTQNINYLNVSKSGDVLVVDGTVPANAAVGKVTENIYVNGDVYTVEITVVEAGTEASSSSQATSSSSSVVVSSNWVANANLTNGSNGEVAIGSTNDWVSERVVTKNLGALTSGETYTLSFEASLQQNTMDMAVSLGSNCSESVALSETAGASKYTCTFTAKEAGDAVLTLTMPGSRWELVTVSGLSLKNGSGEEVIPPSSTSTGSSSSATVAGSSSSGSTMYVASFAANPLSLAVADRTLHVMGVDMAMVDVFDLQGRPVASFKQVKGAVSLDMLRQGNYIVRVRSGSNNLVRRISIK
jgi:flagella basal body P-ring formation protein FlgA